MGVIDLVSNLIADRKIRRLLRTAPHRSLEDLPENEFARVTGRVEPLDSRVLEAPLSGRICAYYSLVVLERHRSVRELATEQQGIPFVLAAGTQHAVIDLDHARISSGYDHKRDVRELRELDDRQRAILGHHDLFVHHSFLNRELLFREAVLAVGEQIVIFGAGMREPAPEVPEGERGYRDGLAMRLRFTGTRRFPLVISDDQRSL